MQSKSVVFRVASIVMMVAGIIGAVANFFGAIVFSWASNSDVIDYANKATGSNINFGLLWFATILGIAASVVEIVAGVMGKNNCTDTSKAQTFMYMGIGIAAVSLLSTILTIVAASTFDFSSFLSIASGIAVPVFYTVTAAQLKSQG